MQQNNILLTPQHSAEWLASWGFIFPRNKRELSRLDSLCPIDAGIPEDVVNPHAILKRSVRVVRFTARSEDSSDFEENHRLVARGLSPLPQRIIDKLKQFQQGK